MIFVMNDTDISIFGTGKLDIPFGDNSIYIICKDVKKTAFSAEQIEKILSFAQAHQDSEIKFLQAESKEELLFIIGGLAFTGEERVSLVNLSVNIPKAYADRVELVCTEAKPKRRRRSKSDQNPLIPPPVSEELKRARSSKNRIPLTDKKEESAGLMGNTDGAGSTGGVNSVTDTGITENASGSNNESNAGKTDNANDVEDDPETPKSAEIGPIKTEIPEAEPVKAAEGQDNHVAAEKSLKEQLLEKMIERTRNESRSSRSTDEAGDKWRRAFEERKKEHLKDKAADSLVPQETDEQIRSSLEGKELAVYDLLKIKSQDIGYTWHTSMLIYNIISLGEEVDTAEDFEYALKGFRNGAVYEKCKDKIPELFAIIKKE